MKMMKRLAKVESALKVRDDEFDESSFDSFFDNKSWGHLSPWVAEKDRESFFKSCRKRGINNGQEYMDDLMNSIAKSDRCLPKHP